MEILVLQPGIEPMPPAVEVIFNHWTTREAPEELNFLPRPVSNRAVGILHFCLLKHGPLKLKHRM